MIISSNRMRGYSVEAESGRAGTLDGLLFDDRRWAVRYLVVRTSRWRDRRKLLVVPSVISAIVPRERLLNVRLTVDELERAPGIDADAPVARRLEQQYAEHYRWPAYWAKGPFRRIGIFRRIIETPDRADDEEDGEAGTHVRSSKEVVGYAIRGTDDELGHVDDLLVDTESWLIRYLILDTSRWWPGRRVLIAAEWIEDVSWRERQVEVNLPRAAIEDSPSWDWTQPVDRAAEQRLYATYRRPGTWTNGS